MRPNRKAQFTTLLLIAALGSFALWKQGTFQRVTAGRSAPVQPQEAIYQMLDAVREGNLPKFVEAHTGAMETSLRRVVAEVGEARLLKSLQEQYAPVKGVAILEPERFSEREVKARVEYVFADRNEAQEVYLEKIGEGWKIARVDGTKRLETPVPYGTPVK